MNATEEKGREDASEQIIDHSEERKLLVNLRAKASNFRVTEAALRELITESSPGWKIYIAESETSSDGDVGSESAQEALREIEDAEVYFGFGITRPLFLAARKLKWVHSASAGVGGVLFDEMVASDVALTNSAGIYGPTIAEHVLGGVLYFLRSFDFAVEAQSRATWVKGELTGGASPMRELAGASVLIMGTGGIGSEIARRMAALGAHCTGIRRRVGLGAPPGFERVVGLESLDGELPQADIVIVAVPATRATAELLTRRRIALLRRGAIVVNVARGSLLDESALMESLRGGRIRGAFLDVTSAEPLPMESPLWHTPGVFITPHVSGVSPDVFWKREMALFLDNWQRYKSGMPLRNLVDKHAGY